MDARLFTFRLAGCRNSLVRQIATAVTDKLSIGQEQSLQPFICPITDPVRFSLRNEGQWYFMDPSHFNHLKLWKAVSKLFVKQVETFRECRTMVRRPLLDVLNCWKVINADFPVTRFLLYGKNGCGKTITLAQLVHAAILQKYVVCYVPFARDWNRNLSGIAPSTWKVGRIDLPLEAAAWLTNFKAVNESLITEAKLTCTKDYVWSTRETSESGQPLMSVVETGINRPRFASDCIGVLLKELKTYASEKKIKLFVGIDSANSLFAPLTLKISKDNPTDFNEISVRHAFKKIIKNDWNNGIIILTVDEREFLWYTRPPYMPYYLLGKEGFEWLDPFIPIELPKYTNTEAFSCVDYYIERKWIQNEEAKTDEGKQEVVHLSGHNPRHLERLCASL